MINLDDYINTLLNINNYVQLCKVDNAYTCAYMLEVFLLLILLMGKSTLRCHNSSGLESFFKVFF